MPRLSVMPGERVTETASSAASILLLLDRHRQLLARSALGPACQSLNVMIRLEAGRLMELGQLKEETLAKLCEACLSDPDGHASSVCFSRGQSGQVALSFHRLTTHNGLSRDDWLMIRIQSIDSIPDFHRGEGLGGHRLTRAQSRILGALMRGLDARAIAEQHHISLSPVRTQLQQLRKRFGCRRTAELILRVTALSASSGAFDSEPQQPKNHQK